LVAVVTAYILIQTEVGKAAQVAKDIVEITGVQQAEDVTVLSPTSLAILLRRPSGDLWKN
jgi:flavodoxin